MTELEKQLVQQFYNWEVRGRGWVQHAAPVVLEPAFRPFRYRIPRPRTRNAGQMPTLLSTLVSAVGGLFAREAAPSVEEEEEKEVEPEADEATGQIVEIVATLPPGLAVSAEQSAGLIASLGVCHRPVALEYVANERNVVVQWAVEERDVDRLEAQCHSLLPEVTLTQSRHQLQAVFEQAAYLSVVEVGLDLEFLVPLTIFQRLDPDPLLSLIAVLGSLKEGECGLYQVLFAPVRHQWAPSMRATVSTPDGAPLFVNAPELVEQVTAKTASPLYAVGLRMAVGAADERRAHSLIGQLGDGLRGFGMTEGGNQLVGLRNDRQSDTSGPSELLLSEILERRTRRSGMILNLSELTSLAHPPSASVKHPRLVRQVRKTKAAPEHLREGPFALGENEHGGRVNKVTLSSEERVRHMHIIGATGTGKSTLLLNSIVQDILAGQGVAVLDPHGDLIDKVISYIPTWRIPDVILFDPSDEEYPVGFNILSAHSDLERTLLASDLCAVFQRQSTSWGDQMTTVLSNAILAFLESNRGGTLADLRRFLLEEDYRREFLTTVAEPEIIYFWERNFPQVSGKPQASIVTRLDAFLRAKAVRYMVCQKESPLDFAKVMDQGKIFLAKLPQGLIGQENAHLLGTLLVSKFQQTAIARQAQAAEERRDFWLYIDECHYFVTPSMGDILSGTRKYRLGLILAHQDLRQLMQRDADLGSAVIATPATRVCFRLGEEDARKLEEGFSFFERSDLVNLGIGEAICRVGRSEHDFNLRIPTLLKVEEGRAPGVLEEVRAHTRRVYARPREQVAEEYRKANACSGEAEQKKTRSKKPDTTHDAVEPISRGTVASVPPPTVDAQPKRESGPEQGPPAIRSSEDVLEQPGATQPPAPEPTQTRAAAEEFPKLAEILAQVPPESETQPETGEETAPRPLGRGGLEHQYLQRYLKEIGEQFGFRATIEKAISGGSVDVLLERDGEIIALEISVTTGSKHEVQNLEKCLNAGFPTIVAIGNNARRLSRFRKAMEARFTEEQLTRIRFHTPESFVASLAPAAPKPSPGKKKVRGYDVTSAQPTGKNATGQPDQVVHDAVAKALKRQKSKSKPPS